MDIDKKTVFETFRDIGGYEIHTLMQKEPSCWNGMVRVRRYRVTVELIDEPVEVIQERLRDMWATNKNMHNFAPLLAIGKKYGIDLNINRAIPSPPPKDAA